MATASPPNRRQNAMLATDARAVRALRALCGHDGVEALPRLGRRKTVVGHAPAQPAQPGVEPEVDASAPRFPRGRYLVAVAVAQSHLHMRRQQLYVGLHAVGRSHASDVFLYPYARGAAAQHHRAVVAQKAPSIQSQSSSSSSLSPGIKKMSRSRPMPSKGMCLPLLPWCQVCIRAWTATHSTAAPVTAHHKISDCVITFRFWLQNYSLPQAHPRAERGIFR